jgi:hypothetical protein
MKHFSPGPTPQNSEYEQVNTTMQADEGSESASGGCGRSMGGFAF